jgi:hypothetical protein
MKSTRTRLIRAGEFLQSLHALVEESVAGAGLYPLYPLDARVKARIIKFDVRFCVAWTLC